MTSRNYTADVVDLRPLIIYTTHVVGYVEIVYFLIGVPVNSLVILLCSRLINRVNHHNQLIVMSMTVADLTFSLVHCSAMGINYGWTVKFPAHFCYFVYLTTYICTVASSLSLLMLNIDKFLYLHKPLHYFILVSRTKILFGIAACWLIALAWSTVFLLGPATMFVPQASTCSFQPKYLTLYIVFMVAFFMVPSIISFLTSIYIGFVVIRTKQKNILRQQRSRHYELTYGGKSKPHNRASARMNRQSPSSSGQILQSTSSSPKRMGLKRKIKWRNRPSYVNAHEHLKSILFVFSTTLWCVVTTIPYRTAYITGKLMNQKYDKFSIVLFYALLLLMLVNPVGNPVITILTQKVYITLCRKLFTSRGYTSYENTKSQSVTMEAKNGIQLIIPEANNCALAYISPSHYKKLSTISNPANSHLLAETSTSSTSYATTRDTKKRCVSVTSCPIINKPSDIKKHTAGIKNL